MATSIEISQPDQESNPMHESADSSPPPPYTSHITSRRIYQPLPTVIEVEDEEWTHGFWGERLMDEKEHHSSRRHGEQWDLYDIVCFVCAVAVCILACLGVVLVLGVSNQKIGFPVKLDLSWLGRQKHLNEMRFCLDTPNRQAPGPQMWRYMAHDGHKCDTEIVSLSAKDSEIWKMKGGDGILIGEEGGAQDRKDEFVQFSKVYRA